VRACRCARYYILKAVTSKANVKESYARVVYRHTGNVDGI